MTPISRRNFLTAMSGALASSLASTSCSRSSKVEAGCSMGFGTYGLPGYSLENAIRLVAGIGYDAVEIVSMPGYHGDPDTVSTDSRSTVRRILADSGLNLGALMGLPIPNADTKASVGNRDRMIRLLDLARDLWEESPPLIQGVLGGGEWAVKRSLFRDQVGEWAALAAEAGVAVAIKPHRSHTMSTPARAVWIMDQLDFPSNLSMVYDYSHYAFRDMTIESTVAESYPHTGYVVMKDAVEEGERVVFKLPGETGAIDHAKALSLLHERGYRGEVCCEISSLVWRAGGYDPEAAARACYANMETIFREAQTPRAV